MRVPVIVFLGASLALGAGAQATTVQGMLRYDGLAITSTFSTMTSGVAVAYNPTTHADVYGTVSISGSSYTISGVGSGSNEIFIRVSPQSVGFVSNPEGGDLSASTTLTVTGETTITQDLDLGYSPHVTQPLDSNTIWNGTATGCPQGAVVPNTFTLAWDPVPLATSYLVTIQRFGCSGGLLGTDQETPSGTSLQIVQQQLPGEDYIRVVVDAFAGSTKLTVAGYVTFTDNVSTNGFVFRPSGTQSGRTIHPTDAVFLAQVAHLPGVPPSFWKTDLILSNPTTSAVTATLTFTPRDVDGTQTYAESQVDLPAGGSRTITDVLGTLVGASGAGSLEVEPATVEVACRNYTPGTGPGFYGQGFVPIAADQTAWIGGPSQRLGAGGVARGSSRSDLALTEVWGEAVAVRVTLLDRDGTQVGSPRDVSLAPFGTTQINDLVAALGGPTTISEAQVVVDVVSGAGRVGAVLTLVDNGSQDPTTLPLVRR